MWEYKFHSTNEMMQNAPKRHKFWGFGRGGEGERWVENFDFLE
jgi:hypothetical protein